MSARAITAAEFANTLLEHTLVRGRLLPEGYADLTPAEIGFYNYFNTHRARFDPGMAKAQLCQDFWVVYLLDLLGNAASSPGFFVEFGAYDGITLSNTYLLEKAFHWQGILAEPAPTQYAECRKSRNCRVDPRCVWHTSGQRVEFNEVPGREELATVTTYEAADMHAAIRADTKRIVHATTVSLDDLLVEHDAPDTIGYLSIDTEGSEYDILSAFDFRRYRILVLSVEHNFTAAENKLAVLLGQIGMMRVSRSTRLFDDLYVHPDIASRLHGLSSAS